MRGDLTDLVNDANLVFVVSATIAKTLKAMKRIFYEIKTVAKKTCCYDAKNKYSEVNIDC